MITRLRERLNAFVSLLTITSTTSTEFGSSTALVLLGVYMFSPLTDLDRSIPFQRAMLAVLPEWGWGFVFGGLGLAQSVGNVWRMSRTRAVCSWICSGLYGFLAILAMLVRPVSLFLPVCASAAFVMAVCALVMSRARYQKHSGEIPVFRAYRG